MAARLANARVWATEDPARRRYHVDVMRQAIAAAHRDAAAVAAVTGEDVPAIVERWDVSVMAELAGRLGGPLAS